MATCTYIHLQCPDLASTPPMIGPNESDMINTALIKFKYVLRCLSCVSSIDVPSS